VIIIIELNYVTIGSLLRHYA